MAYSRIISEIFFCLLDLLQRSKFEHFVNHVSLGVYRGDLRFN